MRVWLMIFGLFTCSLQGTGLNVLTEEFPDFQYIDSQGNLVGSAVDKVRAVLQTTDIDYSMTVERWAVAYNAAQRNPNSCIFSIARSESREPLFDWLFPIGGFSVSFYGLESRDYNIKSLEDIKRYKTAVIRHNFSHLYLKERGFVEGQHLLIISSFDKVFEVLATRKGLLDLVVLSDVQFEFKSSKEPIAKKLKRIYKLPDFGSELYFACNKALPKPIKSKIIDAYKAYQASQNNR